jgi:hypothetical protein
VPSLVKNLTLAVVLEKSKMSKGELKMEKKILKIPVVCEFQDTMFRLDMST